MTNPFGIDHEIEKSLYGIGNAMGKGSKVTGGKIYRLGAARNARAARRLAATGGKAGNVQTFFGNRQKEVGASLTAIGRTMQAHPEATAVLTTGGVGYGAYKAGQKGKEKVHKSAFGVDHDEIAKADTDQSHRNRNIGVTAGVAGVGAAGTGAVLAGTHMPEHSHYTKKVRAHLASLPPGVHEVDTKMLAKRPRKLGARKQQAPYVAAMAQERPTPYSPVPITRYKDGIIQRDNAHSVMANAMKGRKTLIHIEDAPGYRPSRRTGEELVRRAQMRYQQHRLAQHMNLPEKKIESIRAKYKDSSRVANTTKRPHGVVEEGFKMSKHPFGAKRALGLVRKGHDADPFGLRSGRPTGTTT